MLYKDFIVKDYKNMSDLVIKDVKGTFIIYLETLADQNKINDYILKITSIHRIPKDIKKLIPSPNVKDISSYEDLKLYLETGYTIILNNKQAIAVETKSNLSRAIESPTTESTLFGSKDSLNENFQTNLGLIKEELNQVT